MIAKQVCQSTEIGKNVSIAVTKCTCPATKRFADSASKTENVVQVRSV